MTGTPDAASQFDAFRIKLTEWAETRLTAENKEYVESFKRRLVETGGDISKVMAETRPLLLGPRSWRKLLTALLDVEQTMDKTRRSVWFLGVTPQPGGSRISHAGAWMVYHVDTWHMNIYGLLDRMKRMITLTCRHVVRPREKADELKASLLADVQKMKGVISRTRHAIAHGGGSVEALEEDDLWEPYVVIGPDAWLNITSSYYDAVAGRQAKWHEAIEQSTVQVFAVTEAWLQKLAEEAFH